VSPSTIRVATLNCRNTADNWRKRSRLLIDQLVELDPDVIGLQELRHFPSQGGWIAREAGWRARQPLWLYPAYKTGLWWFWEGIAILTRFPILERETLKLAGQNRVANFTRVRLPAGGVLDFYNTHLTSAGAETKKAQAKAILEWMASRPGTPQVLVGDFNAAPSSPAIRFVLESLRSAHAVAYGTEPPRTVPTPLRRTADPSHGVVMDYILVNDRVAVQDAWLTFDRPAPGDPQLYPSDHFGVAATLTVPA
jgi:endonuclease/exonuclease/phosphatase family metal-dependent hydrolase